MSSTKNQTLFFNVSLSRSDFYTKYGDDDNVCSICDRISVRSISDAIQPPPPAANADGFHLAPADPPADAALTGIFSRKSAASTDSISAMHSETSRSAESKLGGGQKAPSVEKKPQRSWRLAMLWQVSVRKAPFVERGVYTRGEDERDQSRHGIYRVWQNTFETVI